MTTKNMQQNTKNIKQQNTKTKKLSSALRQNLLRRKEFASVKKPNHDISSINLDPLIEN
jgi:hypothetical protein